MKIEIRYLKYIISAAGLAIATVDVSASTQFCDSIRVMESKQPRAAAVSNAAGPRLYFQRNDTKCPGNRDCNAKAYLLPNDKVFIADDGAPWVCAYFMGSKRDTVGWLPRSALVIDSNPALPTQQDWLGTWIREDNYLLFNAGQDGRLVIKGAAFGARNSATGFETEMKPKGNVIPYRDGTCHITMRWVFGYILVSDTTDCVGPFNTYAGIYYRAALTTDPKDEPLQ